MKVLVDSNILLRSAQPGHPQHAAATAAVRVLVGRGETLHIVPQNLYEYWAVATRPLAQNGMELPTPAVKTVIDGLKSAMILLPDLPAIYDQWEHLVVAYDVKGKPSHDARLVAAMQVHGLTHLLTFNGSDFSRFAGEGIVLLDPAVLASA